ncbi:MAG TPA: MarC family protein [Burkholderiales bacterium]|nr:MarC family protein [Burkholderiales bacterium]
MTAYPEYLRFIATLTAVLDPFLAVPIFLSVSASRDAASRKRLAIAVVLTVFVVLAGAALFGETLLKFLGASLPAFRVGGGLVLLLMALAMLNAQAGGMRQSRAEAEEIESGELTGVVPLAVPLLAGPGAIGTTIIATQSGSVAHVAAILGCLALVCCMLWGMLRVADAVGERLGTIGLNIATRLLGLLLAAIAIETMADGLKVLFPVLTAA